MNKNIACFFEAKGLPIPANADILQTFLEGLSADALAHLRRSIAAVQDSPSYYICEFARMLLPAEADAPVLFFYTEAEDDECDDVLPDRWSPALLPACAVDRALLADCFAWYHG